MIKITTLLVTAAMSLSLSAVAQAQDTSTADTPDPQANGASGTTFRGIRVEGDIGGDRFRSEGRHHDKLGYGGTVGFDGTFNNRIVVGAEGSYWRANNWNENCGPVGNGTNVCHKAFEEWGVAGRVGYLVTPQLLVFGKGGYVNGEQRRRITGPTGATLVYDHYKADGYQVGGGVEYDVTAGRMPLYTNVQYVYSGYHGHSSRQRVMLGVGVRFR